MARRSSNPFSEEEEPEVDMSAMIDVAFLLLIYFLVATSLMQEEADLNLALPGTASVEGDAVKIDQMQIRIDNQSAVWMNEDLVETDLGSRELPKLTDRLERYAASARLAGSDAFVIIDCADKAKEQRFVDVLNACSKAGIEKISLSDS